MSVHEDFVAAPNEALAADGEQAEIRTNALLGVTIGLAAVTGLLAAFTDWTGPTGGGKPRPEAPALGAGGVYLAF